jgi:flagellar biosynthetic protein FlhB
VKSRIRSIQMEMARKRMMQDVAKADVVITNPTRLAVALRYDQSKMGAPCVVAKGAGKIAERIRELAELHHIPLMENKSLARNLYKWVAVGHEIPVDYYRVVAEILAYVYKMKGKKN